MADVDALLPYIEPGWSGAEIGTLRAASAVRLLEHGVRRLWLVDPWEGDYEAAQLPLALEALRPYPGRYAIIRAKSDDASSFVPKNLDFVWIDGEHSFQAVLKDMVEYWGKVRPGGILCGHDYFDSPPVYEVKQAVEKFCRIFDVAFGATGPLSDPGASAVPCWLIRKPSRVPHE